MYKIAESYFFTVAPEYTGHSLGELGHSHRFDDYSRVPVVAPARFQSRSKYRRTVRVTEPKKLAPTVVLSRAN